MHHACPTCHSPIRPGARFCGVCGTSLSRKCPNCQWDNAPDNRFCESCGQPLASVRAPASTTGEEKERRVVTVLFADLVDSTGMGESLDPEDLERLVGSAQAVLRDAITEQGGHVLKYLGDGIMALFGAPTAHDDDAERAVIAGLRLHKALQGVNERREPGLPALSLRVGITHGEVVAGAMAGGYDVAGDAVNTAARLQAAAGPGGVLVDGETMRLAQRAIEFGDALSLTVKGKAQPVDAYAAVGLRARPQERWEQHAATSFIGRGAESAALIEAWRRAQAGNGGLITLVGEAGIGKSRLIRTALERIRSEAEAEIVLARCLSYGEHVSLGLVTSIVRSLCDPLGERQGRLAEVDLKAAIDGLLAGESQDVRDATTDVLGEIAGIEREASPVTSAPPEVRRQVAIRGLRLLLAALTRRAPAVLVLEDAHWSDRASMEVLTTVLADVPGLRLLALVSQRPGWSPPWSEWAWPERLALRPMDEEDASALAVSSAGGQTLAPSLLARVLDRADGNPFFLEELVRALRESGELVERDGVLDLKAEVEPRLPASLVEVLMARVDRLSSPARNTAQVGSVIGRQFAVAVLDRVAQQHDTELEDSLTALQHAEIAFPRWTAEREYLFQHALVRDTVYGTVLHARRQTLHARIAAAISELYPADEHPDVVAYHYSQTREDAAAATWAERAGDRALATYANEEAIGFYRTAHDRLTSAEAGPAERARVSEKMGRALKIRGRYNEALVAFERSRSEYRESGDDAGEGRTVAEIGRVHASRGEAAQGRDLVSAYLAAKGGDVPAEARMRLASALATLECILGDYAAQQRMSEEAAALARSLGDDRSLVEAEISRGTALFQQDHVAEGVRVWEQVIPPAERSGDLINLWTVLDSLGLHAMAGGEFGRSLEFRQRALTLADRLGDPIRAAFTLTGLGEVLFYQGRWIEAHAHLDEALDRIRQMEPVSVSPYPRLVVGALLMAQGAWAEAANLLATAEELAVHGQDRQARQWVCGLLAELDLLHGNGAAALARIGTLFPDPIRLQQDVTYLLPVAAWVFLDAGQSEDAELTISEGITRARQELDRVDLVDALRVAAMLHLGTGSLDEAAARAREGLALAGEMGYPYAEVRLLCVLGAVCLARGDEAAAREAWEAAREKAQSLGARYYAQEAAELLAALDG